MPTEIFKIVVIAVVAFTLGSTFIDGRQTLEITNLSKQITQLKSQLSEKENQLKTAQVKAESQRKAVKEFLKKLEN